VDVAARTPYFLILRRGPFDETAVALPHFLHGLGVTAVIPPLPARSGLLWGELASYHAILYPYIDGRNAYEARLTDTQWQAFARALKQMHTAVLPRALAARLPREQFAPVFRDRVRHYLALAERDVPGDPVAQAVAALLREQRVAIQALLARAERLAQVQRRENLPFVLCHSDLHAGNLFLAENGALYLVDWDEPLLAPRERDLMYVGGGLLASGLAAQEEEDRFYAEYGRSGVRVQALSYYRYERIIQDLAAYCEELLLTETGGADRPQSLRYLQSNFLPGGTIAVAQAGDREEE
jgi:spectinomycin phosphotransferase